MYNVGYSIDKDDNKVAYEFASQLPHGSGIDGSWDMEVKGSYVYFTNSYHCMDEYGGYDGWQDFRIRIDKTIWKLFEDAVNKMNAYKYEPSNAEQTQRMIVLRDIIAEKFDIQFSGGNYKAKKYMIEDYLIDAIVWDIKGMAF